jgi:hypothetical protein
MSSGFRYRTDQKKGADFTQTSTSQSWVEHLNTLGQVYYAPEMGNVLYDGEKFTRRQHLIKIFNADFDADTENFDFLIDSSEIFLAGIRHLAEIRMVETFVLPIFIGMHTKTNQTVIQCGHTRMMACLMCGIPQEKIPIIGFSKPNQKIPALVQPVQSTQHFNDLFDLNQTDYELTYHVDDAGNVNFCTSILRHTIYEIPAFKRSSEKVKHTNYKKFWSRFRQPNNKFQIQIHCTAHTKSFVGQSDILEIEYVEKNPQEWQFSYGMILGAFTQSQTARLQLWLYDVTEPVHIELMMPWMVAGKNFYKTQNSKAVIICNDGRADSCELIGNWLQ